MRHYDTIATLERNGFEIIVDKTWEDIHPSDCFDDSVTDIKDMCRKIDQGDLDWFMLRVRALVDGHELAANYLGGCLYDWDKVKDVMTDGTAEDMIWETVEEAKKEVDRLSTRLWAIQMEMDAAG